MPLLQVIVASTRPGRVGRTVGEWFASAVADHDGFAVELVDLLEVGLPMFDEPKHPRFQEYTHAHTHRWSETISRGDAYAFVMPEYNYGYSAPLKNAIDFLWREWNDKPAILVGYGGVSGGIRAMQSLKPVLTSVRLGFVAEVPIPFVHEHVADGAFTPTPPMIDGVRAALDAAARLHGPLSSLRGAAVS